MKIVWADLNAMTEEGLVRLGCRGSRDSIERQRVGVGDRVWLEHDGMRVAAIIEAHPDHGTVGRPEWDTLVDEIDLEDTD